MKIYAVIGTAQQTIIADTVQYNPQENEVLMQSERPADGDYIATESGVWVIDINKQIEALDNEYTKEKAILCEQYTDAQIHGDVETAEEIVNEMTSLDNWYDEEYQKITNEGGEA